VTVGSFTLAAALLGTFVFMQSRSSQPLMPLRLFKNPTRDGAYLVMLIIGAAVFAMFYFLTQYVQNVLGFSPIRAGLAFLPVSATIVVVAQVVSRLVQRIEPKVLIAGGTVFGGLGLYYLSRLTVDSSYWHVLPAIVMIAMGMGSIFVPITLAAVAGVEREDTGVASAMLNVGQQVGGTIGLASLVTVFSHSATSYVNDHHLPPTAVYLPPAFTHGADAAFLAGALFMVVGLVAALLLIKIRPGEAAEGAPEVPG
jgi:predicted MFS family arabinose efflux permease